MRRPRSGILALSCIPLAVAWLPSPGPLPSSADNLLDHLLGSWTLSGTMGATPLRQQVVATKVLQGQFVQIHFTDTGPKTGSAQPYEAIYMLGYDADTRQYIMYLFDTFGVPSSRTMGVGTRRDNTIVFRFDYPTGPFTNTFTWHEDAGEWDMVLRAQTATGDWELFATKRLTPAG